MLGDTHTLLHKIQQEGKSNYQHMYISMEIANEAKYAMNYKRHFSEHIFAFLLDSNNGNK